MNWSAEQQRLLGAMGFQLMTRVEPGESSGARVTAPAAALAAAPAPAVAMAAGAGSIVMNFPALRQALRRAAGDRDIDGLVEDIERLRREPALKRALWSRLRILRRSP
ncbi:MAG: hypothetical protein KAY12_04820 [Arenimonas sp.]|nr:hypothetical protein [Arenimonas sp.]